MKQFEEFHTPAVGILLSSYSSPEHVASPYNEHCNQRIKSVDLRTTQLDTEELKLSLSLLCGNKDKGRTEKDYPDMTRTPNSKLYTSNDIVDPSRPKLGPFCTQLEERQETSGAHVSGSTTPKSTESVNTLSLDLTSKNSFESVKRLSTDENETTESVQIEILDSKHSESSFEYSLKSAGRFQRFRKWFKRLCCCCSDNGENSSTDCS